MGCRVCGGIRRERDGMTPGECGGVSGGGNDGLSVVGEDEVWSGVMGTAWYGEGGGMSTVHSI